MMWFWTTTPQAPPSPVISRTTTEALAAKVDRMSAEVDALTPKIDSLVTLIHQLVAKIGTPVAVSPEDSATLSSDGGKLDAAIAAANSVLTPPAA